MVEEADIRNLDESYSGRDGDRATQPGEKLCRLRGKASWEQSAKRQLRPMSQKNSPPPKPTEWAIATAVGCPPELGGKNLLLDPLQAPLEIISRAQF